MAEKRSKVGRPTRFNAKLMDAVLILAEAGKTEDEIGALLGITSRTMRTWKGKHAEFLPAIREAKDIADDLVEASLFQRAIGWTHIAEKAFYNAKQDKVVTHRYVERYPPDVAAAIIWLKNRRPELWRQNPENDPGDDPETIEGEVVDTSWRPVLKNADAVGSHYDRKHPPPPPLKVVGPTPPPDE